MITHPAIQALEQEIENYHHKACELSAGGFTATAHLYRNMARGLKTAIAVVRPHLEENES